MSVTEEYGRMHNAITGAAKAERLDGVDVRVLVALAEAGGSLTHEELMEPGYLNPSQVRRASLHLRERNFVEAAAADELGGPPRTGCFVRLSIHGHGSVIAERVLAEVGFPMGLAVAA